MEERGKKRGADCRNASLSGGGEIRTLFTKEGPYLTHWREKQTGEEEGNCGWRKGKLFGRGAYFSVPPKERTRRGKEIAPLGGRKRKLQKIRDGGTNLYWLKTLSSANVELWPAPRSIYDKRNSM